MALSHGDFPYDINNLLGGAVRVLITPAASALPVSPIDIFDQEDPYDANAPWVDLGATKEAFRYGRNIDVGSWRIQQQQSAVVEEVTQVLRSIRVSMAEFGPASLKILEQQETVDDIAAAAGHSAFKKVGFGTIDDLVRYRVAFVSKRSVASGLVTESVAAKKRGRFFVGVGYNVAVSADNVEVEANKGDLSAAQVTFHFYPDATIAQGKEYGAWFDEASGVIA